MLEKKSTGKMMYRDGDRETVFYEWNVEKAKRYYGAPEGLTTLEEIAEWYNEECLPIEQTGGMVIEEHFDMIDPEEPESASRYTLVSVNRNGSIEEYRQ